VVERWVVHARSESLVLESERLAFIPLCLGPSPGDPVIGDDGYLFMGGRKWREIEVGLAAMSRSGIPGKVITDFAPEGDLPGIDLRREKVPREEYAAAMQRARLILVPLKQMPISHGHTDVVAAIVAGKPVLVTACSSCDDYVDHGVNGLLVRDNSVEAWTDAIHQAYEKADDFAAAAREMAPRYYSRRYGGYLREVAEDLDRHRVRPEVEHAKPYAPRAEWVGFRQENYLRRLKVEHRTRIDAARQMMRERRYEEALAEVDVCLGGPLGTLAAQIRESALAGKATARR
jgi:glycosyltransferase involved in cell wall biosynthesis